MDWWTVIEPYVLTFFVLTVAIAAIVYFRRGKRARRNWLSLAARYGLEYTPPGPAEVLSRKAAIAFQDPGEVKGVLDGLPFRLYVAIYGTSKDRRIFTIIKVEIPGVPDGLKIYQTNVFNKFMTYLGAQDIITGDPEFDRVFVVKGDNQDEALSWLNDQRRQALLKIMGDNSSMDIREGSLHFQQGEVCADAEVLEGAIQNMRELIPFLR